MIVVVFIVLIALMEAVDDASIGASVGSIVSIDVVVGIHFVGVLMLVLWL